MSNATREGTSHRRAQSVFHQKRKSKPVEKKLDGKLRFNEISPMKEINNKEQFNNFYKLKKN